jgi:serine/threonine protein kinase
MLGIPQRLMGAASLTTPPLLHGRYRITDRLGDSRLATVWLAEDQRLKRTVLVHLLRADLMQHPQLHERFADEARRSAQRSHPGLLEVYDTGEIDGRPYLVTEYVEGRPLAVAGMLAVGEALHIAHTISSAIALAQSVGAPHPPISSNNVWLLPGSRAVLVENWMVGPEKIGLDLAAYHAPEQRRGVAPSPASTTYALGILTWETLVGRRPFDGTTPDEIARQQQQAELLPVSLARPGLFSPELDRIVAQAVARDPQQRYSTPADFASALGHYIAATNAHTGRVPALSQPTSETAPLKQSLLRRPAGRPASAVAPPPPPPVIREPQTETLPAQPVAASRANQPSVEQQVQRAVRRELRRRSCINALIKRSIQLVLAFVILYGGYLGIRYAVDYATGQVQQFDARDWLSQQVPDVNEIVNDLIPPWLRTFTMAQTTYRITQPINLRSEPSAAGDDTVIQVLQAGTRIQQQGAPQADEEGQPYQWIPVRVLDTDTEGWVALQEGRLEPE